MSGDKTTLELCPKSAEMLAKFIQEHPGEFIMLNETLGIGYGYTLLAYAEDSEVDKDITDYDSF